MGAIREQEKKNWTNTDCLHGHRTMFRELSSTKKGREWKTRGSYWQRDGQVNGLHASIFSSKLLQDNSCIWLALMGSLARAQLASDQVLSHRGPIEKESADLSIRLLLTLLSKLKLKGNKDDSTLNTIPQIKKEVTKAAAPENSLWPKIITP